MTLSLLLFIVRSVLADGREDNLRYPVLEGFGFRLVGAHDQLVEARFGDDRNRYHLRPTHSGLLIVTVNVGLETLGSG